ncbi:translation initiation factor IF-2-like [Mustela erminea]|uniref:translation initiation factor IF-2-like n=1 Tax=Mustela erminea TaxID=36723 RepID=UPI0013868260|nr:translation initiation factor IF-2-like [Mustela erminea]
MRLWANENFRGGGGEKGGKSEALATAPGGGERGRTPDPLLLTPTLGPRPTAASPSPEGAIKRGVGGPHPPHPQPRPAEGERAGRPDPPPQPRSGVPAAGETSRRPAAGVCKAPSTAWAPGAAAPSGGEGDRGGEEAVNSPSVRASPRRAPLPRPRRGPPGSPARPRAAPPGAPGTGVESGLLPGGLRQLAERSQQRRRGKSGLTCHYFLRHLGSTCQRPHKALWMNSEQKDDCGNRPDQKYMHHGAPGWLSQLSI